MASHANETCEKLLRCIKQSQLDFLLQETPYSAFITVRKRFVKNFNAPSATHGTVESDKVIEDLRSENEKLRDVISEKDAEIESFRNGNFILQNRLGKAEKDMLKHFEESSVQKSKLSEEINFLKV